MMSGGLSRSDSARETTPTAIKAAAATAEWRAGLGLGGRPEDCEDDGHCDQPPGKAEPLDAMVDRGLERRGEHDPERETHDRPGDCRDCPDDGAVGQQHEAEMLLRGADGGEHAELAEPSLRDDREPRGGNERSQEEEDGGHRGDRERLGCTTDIASANLCARERPARVVSVTQGSEERLA